MARLALGDLRAKMRSCLPPVFRAPPTALGRYVERTPPASRISPVRVDPPFYFEVARANLYHR